jgi:hypothetical protein
LRKSADEHFLADRDPRSFTLTRMGHGWVILVRRTQEREHALVEKVVKVKPAGVALSVLSHEQQVFTRGRPDGAILLETACERRGRCADS